MSTKRSSSRSPRKTEKKRVKINDETQVLLFEKQPATSSPQENPYHKDKPSPETHQQEMERKTREARALDNRYKNSAAIKDRRSYRRLMLRQLASQASPEQLIVVPRRDKSFAIRAPEKVMSEPAPQKKKSFVRRMFSAILPKKKAGRKTQKRRR
jgi:hypothetical protein